MSAALQAVPPIAGLVGVGATALLVGLALVAFGYWLRSRKDDSSYLAEVDDVEGGHGFEVDYSPSKPGLLGSYLKEREKRKALKNDYVRWHIIGSSFSKPKYVQPERKEGGNVPELEHKGDTYNFPESAAVPAQEEGAPVVIHRKGEAEPINLRDGWHESIDAGTLTEYLTLRVTSKKPTRGLLDGLGFGDYDSMTIFRYGLLAIVALFIILETVGGGIA